MAGRAPARLAYDDGVVRPRTKPVEERRADLLDAAEELALGKGVDGITVDAVTAGAGVSKGTFYLYFRSKDDVLDALRERYLERFLAMQMAAVASVPADDWPGRIEAWVIAGIEDYLGDPRLHDVVFRHSESEHDPLAEHKRTPIAELTALLEDGISAGAFRLADPEATATLLYYTMHGIADHLIHYSGGETHERLAREVRRLTRALLI
jgi:AcrR family transcriptional regulator